MANLYHDNLVNFPDALRLAIARASHDILSFEDVRTILSCADILSISEGPADPDHNGLYLYRDNEDIVYDRVVWHEVYLEICHFREFEMVVEISKKFVVVQPEGQFTFWRRVYSYAEFEALDLVQTKLTRDVDYYLIGYSISSEDEDDQGDDDQGEDDHVEQGEDDHNQISEIAFSADVASYRQQHLSGSTAIAPAAGLLPVDTAGRALELLLILEQHWSQRGFSFPIYFLTYVSSSTIDYVKSFLEWMSDSISKSFETSRANVFLLRHVTLLINKTDLDNAPPGPKVVLASMASLEAGFARDIFVEWANDPRNLVLFTETGQEGVILGADTRATEGPIFADKNCEKIHYMAPNIYCCGAGTAADTEAVTDMVSSQLRLHRYQTGRDSRVITALTLLKKHLFSYQGHDVSAALVLGGVDITGPHLHTIYPHGSTDTLPFATMGSGSLAAMAVFEAKYKEGQTRDEGIKLVAEAICSGIFNDLGSDSNVDICVITKGNKEYLRNYMEPNPRTYVSSKDYSFTKKTEVLLTKITPLMERVEITEVGEAMEE